MRLSLILPTLDEREHLEWLLPRLLSELPDLEELIVVDDGSRDGTRELVRRFGQDDGRVQLLARSARPSLTQSLREGIAASRGDVIGWMDADGVCPVADFRALVAAVGTGADLAIASRFLSTAKIKGQRREGLLGRLSAPFNLRASRDPWLGVAASLLLNVVVVPLITGEGIHDYTSGIVVGRRTALETFELRGDHGEYCIGLVVEARRRGLRLVELPYDAQPRTHGRSKTVPAIGRFLRRGAGYLRATLDVARMRRTRLSSSA